VRRSFDLLEQPFAQRGKRTDEMIELLRAMWQPGWVEHHGELYDIPRLEMTPVPTERVPILVGGISDAAMRRAARHDGWLADYLTIEGAIAARAKLDRVRDEYGRSNEPFSLVAPLVDASVPDDFRRAEEAGVTDVLTMPWAFSVGLDAPLDQKIESLARYHEDIVAPVNTSEPSRVATRRTRHAGQYWSNVGMGTGFVDEQKIADWVSDVTGGSVTRVERQARWRRCWWVDVERDGERIPLYLRGNRVGFGAANDVFREARAAEAMAVAGIPAARVWGQSTRARRRALGRVARRRQRQRPRNRATRRAARGSPRCWRGSTVLIPISSSTRIGSARSAPGTSPWPITTSG